MKLMNNQFLEFSRQEIEEYINSRGSDNKDFFCGDFEGGYYLQQHPPEFSDFLFKYRGTRIENYAEIGVAAAGFTRIMSEFMDIGNMYLVDLFEHPAIEHAYVKNMQAIRKNIRGKVHCFWGNSHSEEAQEFLKLPKCQMDFGVIDAGHEYKDVIQDFEAFWWYGCKTFFFHDHLVCPGVNQAINELITAESEDPDCYPALKIIDRFETKQGITICKNYND